MKGNEGVGVLYSWPVIVFALLIFWPLGLFLIIKRAYVDPSSAAVVGKFIGALGFVLYILAAFCLFVAITNVGESEVLTGGTTLAAVLAAVGTAIRKAGKNIAANAGYSDAAYDVQNDADAAPEQERIVQCVNCGAHNTVSGSTGVCEYCGSPLQ